MIEVSRQEPLLTPGEAAAFLNVSLRTVNRRPKQQQMQPIRTVGAHRRWRESDIRLLLRIYGRGAR